MLNERKIRLMTRLSVYEKGMGIKDDRQEKYFRNDYVFGGMIGSFVTGTIAWGVCAAVYCGYFFEQIFFSVYEDRLGPTLRLAAVSYIVFMVLYLLITFLIYEGRSMACSRRRSMYEADLNELRGIYDQEYRRAGQLLSEMSGDSGGKPDKNAG